MILIDLTRDIYNDMPVFPGDKPVRINQTHQVNEDGYSNFRIEASFHIGTHIDAPAHFLENGIKINDIELDLLCGDAVLIDARNKFFLDTDLINGLEIHSKMLVFCTMHYNKWGTDEYYSNYPVISHELCDELIKKRVKMILLDTPSPDKSPYEIHPRLFGANILIAENIINTEKLIGRKNIRIYALPLKAKVCGAPARIIAQYDI